MKVMKKDEMKKALSTRTRSARPWKLDIIEFLVKRPGNHASDLEIYNATRPDRLEISEAKKKHNMASQWTYIAQDGLALIEGHSEKRLLVAITEETEKLLQVNK